MKKRFETVKGTIEYLPQEQLIREQIKSILQSTFIKYGFAPVETPILSSYNLLASKYSEGADILNEMYTMSDRGNRDLGLRYDLTISFCKLITSNTGATLPFKRYEIGKVFRDGPVRVGRNREFTQCDVDSVGIDSLLAEAEYMEMMSDAFNKLGLDIIIKFNNRKLLTGIIKSVCGELPEKDIRKIIILIDKFAKMNRDQLQNEFSKIGIEKDKFETLFELFSLDFKDLENTLKDFPQNSLLEEGINETKELMELVQGTGAEEVMSFAPYLARGIDIYTGTVWEVFLKDGKINSGKEILDFTNTSIGGGGRYDKILTDFINDGKNYPAVGMSFGLDVIYEILTRTKTDSDSSFIDLFIIPMETQKESFKLASDLRRAGINVEIEKVKRRVGKSMAYANKNKIPFTSVIGSNEIEKGQITIKEMDSGNTYSLDLENINAMKDLIKPTTP